MRKSPAKSTRRRAADHATPQSRKPAPLTPVVETDQPLQLVISLTKEDVTAIAVERAREALEDTLAAKQQQLHAVRQKVARLGEEAQSLISQYAREIYASQGKLLAATVSQLCGREHRYRCDTEFTWAHLEAGQRLPLQQRVQRCNVTIHIDAPPNNGEGSAASFGIKLQLEPPASVEELLDAYDAGLETIRSLEREAVHVKSQLGTLPAYERKVRARLAEAALQRTSGGREALAAITQNLGADFGLALSGPSGPQS